MLICIQNVCLVGKHSLQEMLLMLKDRVSGLIAIPLLLIAKQYVYLTNNLVKSKAEHSHTVYLLPVP